MNIESVKLSQIKVNAANPRLIKDAKFEKLINSILSLPKMLELRPIVVDDTYTALGGNMRYRALLSIAEMSDEDLKFKLRETKSFQQKTSAEQKGLLAHWHAWKDNPTAPVMKASMLSDAEQREFIIKDNVGYGEWDMDMLANEWDSEELQDWGVEVWGAKGNVNLDAFFEEDENKEAKQKELLCPHCGKNIYETETEQADE